jgi:hypothetical protein
VSSDVLELIHQQINLPDPIEILNILLEIIGDSTSNPGQGVNISPHKLCGLLGCKNYQHIYYVHDQLKFQEQFTPFEANHVYKFCIVFCIVEFNEI